MKKRLQIITVIILLIIFIPICLGQEETQADKDAKKALEKAGATTTGTVKHVKETQTKVVVKGDVTGTAGANGAGNQVEVDKTTGQITKVDGRVTTATGETAEGDVGVNNGKITKIGEGTYNPCPSAGCPSTKVVAANIDGNKIEAAQAEIGTSGRSVIGLKGTVDQDGNYNVEEGQFDAFPGIPVKAKGITINPDGNTIKKADEINLAKNPGQDTLSLINAINGNFPDLGGIEPGNGESSDTNDFMSFDSATVVLGGDEVIKDAPIRVFSTESDLGKAFLEADELGLNLIEYITKSENPNAESSELTQAQISDAERLSMKTEDYKAYLSAGFDPSMFGLAFENAVVTPTHVIVSEETTGNRNTDDKDKKNEGDTQTNPNGNSDTTQPASETSDDPKTTTDPNKPTSTTQDQFPKPKIPKYHTFPDLGGIFEFDQITGATRNFFESARGLFFPPNNEYLHFGDVQRYVFTPEGRSPTIVENGKQVRFQNGLIFVKSANLFIRDKSILTNLENLVSGKSLFYVEKADSLHSECARFNDIINSTFKITDDRVEVTSTNLTTYNITDCIYNNVYFESRGGTLLMTKVVPPTYLVKNGTLIVSQKNYTERVDVNNSAEIEFDMHYGIKCVTIEPEGTYWYNDKISLKRDFAINVPSKTESFKLCIRRDSGQNFSRYDGMINFVQDFVSINKEAKYLKYPMQNNEVASLLMSPLHQNAGNFNITLQFDEGFTEIQKIEARKTESEEVNKTITTPNNVFIIKEKQQENNIHRLIKINRKKTKITHPRFRTYQTNYFSPILFRDGTTVVQREGLSNIRILPNNHKDIITIIS